MVTTQGGREHGLDLIDLLALWICHNHEQKRTGNAACYDGKEKYELFPNTELAYNIQN